MNGPQELLLASDGNYPHLCEISVSSLCSSICFHQQHLCFRKCHPAPETGWKCVALLVSYRSRPLSCSRPVLLWGSLIFGVGGTLFSTFAPSVATIGAARIVVGIAVGVYSFVAPLYTSEVRATGRVPQKMASRQYSTVTCF